MKLGIGIAIATVIAFFARRVGSSSSPSVPSPATPPLDPWGTREDLATGVCEQLPNPGVQAFRAWVLRTRGGRDGGILRDCSIGSKSEHHEGRAWDWMTTVPEGRALVDELLADDAARARAAGILYLIHDRRMWRAYEPRGWSPYGGQSPHTDHVHFSFTRAGARGETSFYQQGIA